MPVALAAPPASFAPEQFEREGYPHEAWRRLRAEAPVASYEGAGQEPCWLVTRYDDIVAIERDAHTFINGRGVTVMNSALRPGDAALSAIPMLLTMDPPKHGKYRGVVRERFRPQAFEGLSEEIAQRCRLIADDVVREHVGKSIADGTAFDFVTTIAARLPLEIVLAMLGVPSEDRDQIFLWSNRVIGHLDPEYAGSGGVGQARADIFGYFAKFVAARRAQPRDDLVSLLVEARIDGEPLPELDILGFCFILALAGNETTRNATSGGLLALIEHPSEMSRLRSDPTLIPMAVEEILRWVSPIIYMARTASKDVDLHGSQIREGEKVALIYASANRDEAQFDQPDRFDVARSPNDHLAFGFGRHRCLGNDLARIELCAILQELLRRFGEVELAGPVLRLRSNFVGGIKHMPVRLA